MNQHTYNENVSVIQKQSICSIEIPLITGELYAYNKLTLSIDSEDDIDFLKSLKELGLKYIPEEENNLIFPNEYEVCRFGEAVLNSEYFSLNDKKDFISEMHSKNPKYSKGSLCLYNVNNMNSLNDAEKNIEFFEMLSYFTDLAELGNPSDANFYDKFRKEFPKTITKINNALLLGKMIDENVPSHRKKLAEFSGDIEAYKKSERKKSKQRYVPFTVAQNQR